MIQVLGLDVSKSSVSACLLTENHQEPRRFVQVRDLTIVRIRELILRLAHFNRVQSAIINRIHEIGKQLAEKLDIEKAAGRSVKLVRMKIPLLASY